MSSLRASSEVFHKMNAPRISFTIALACTLYLAPIPHHAAAGEPGSLFEGNGAAEAVTKLATRLKTPVRVYEIEITAKSIVLEVQDPAAPTHINEYLYVGRSGAETISGPTPVKLSLINPRLEENLFDLTEVNFAAVPETIAEALRRAKVEGGAIEEITIRRQVLLNDSGPVQWEMSVRSPRESALAYADAKGKIRRLDLSQTTRAQTMDLTQGGEMLAEAVAQIREQFGTGPVFKSFSISTKSLGFKTRDPKNPAGEVGHYWDINGISKSTDIIPAHIRRKIGEGVRDEMLFRIEDVDWARLPSLRPIALEQAAVPGGRIASIDVDRPSTQGDAKPVRWKLAVRAGVLGESTVVEFDAKTGVPKRSGPTQTGQTALNYVEPETARRALAALGRELNRASGFVEVLLHRERASATVTMTEKPDLIRQFFYTEADGLTPFGMGMPGNPFHPGFNKSWLFAFADLEPALPLLPQLQRKTLERLRLDEATVQRVTFFRHSPFYPQNRKVLVEIRVANPKGEEGRVVYDLQGAVVDTVGGKPTRAADSGTDAGPPAKLRPVGMTDATPERVAKFDSLSASYEKLGKKLQNTRWSKVRTSDPKKVRTLPREVFGEMMKVQQELLDCADQILAVYAERQPPSDAIASSKAKPYERNREYWETQRQLSDVALKQTTLVDENWAEWVATGRPDDAAEFKPWHKEASRLQEEIEAANERIAELSGSKK